MFPPKSAPPPELDVQLFFGISRDLIQQLGEGIQLPLCSSTYFPKCLPLIVEDLKLYIAKMTNEIPFF